MSFFHINTGDDV